ncbi:GAF domain-containing protein [Streptomyces kunmingensis]|uniref:GAF domain-containing protein n=1 Tax=Streptomyces kunmingensis TaxID=68225 RepID=A0ABU6CG02_9ACTN|nr:GAF domain-containing protein [Streptomyces kunmingensis]MEB3963111.1 GAF domain-containing protein [Streptomyces kunmingensis]
MTLRSVSELVDLLHGAARSGRGLSAIPAAVSAHLLGLDAVTLSLLPAGGSPELVWADPADRLGRELDDLQYVAGEGPTWEAGRTGCTVIVCDLAAAAAIRRWPVFAAAAANTGAHAVIAVPLCQGVTVVGVLTGYRTRPAPLSGDQRRDCVRFARAAMDLLRQTPGQTMAVSADGVHLYRAEVHQGAGMLDVQHRVFVQEALLRLRMYPWRHNHPLDGAARDVVAGRLRPGRGVGDMGSDTCSGLGAVAVAERRNHFVVRIEHELELPADLDLLETALHKGAMTGKRVVADLSKIEYLSAETLGCLLSPARRGQALPWLAGPVSTPALGRLRVTGTLRAFRVFPSLCEATREAR